MSSRQKQEQRKKDFKKGIDSEEARKKREDTNVSIRKSKREESLQKKRNISAVVPPLGGKTIDATLQQKLEDLPNLVAGLMSNEPNAQLECTTSFRKLLSIERNPPIQEVINAGVVPRFVQFLTFSNAPQLQVLFLFSNQIQFFFQSSKLHGLLQILQAVLLSKPELLLKREQFQFLSNSWHRQMMTFENKQFGHSEILLEILLIAETLFYRAELFLLFYKI